MDRSALQNALTERFATLPTQLRAVARWVLDHPADVALLTTREQAKRAGLSPATFTRLAQRMGLPGYDALRAAYAASLRQRPDGFVNRATELLERHGDEGDGALAQDMFAALAEHIRALREPESIARLERAATMLADARSVFCFGLRSAFPAVYMLDYIRAMIGAGSVLCDGAGGRGVDALRRIGPGDVLFVASVSPYTRLTVEAAVYARDKGAAIVALTDSLHSPLAALADETVLVRTETPSFFHTMTPAFAVVECLAALMTAKQGKPALDAIAASEAHLDVFSTYETAHRTSRRRK
ncbi:MurR/RpiR family transcriptional regulator [Bosea lathyri]|uniref:Transcriptional regulator, RpiR family n=1 Tax=Bosea lathyri TaxID=1036778 RepID=A0A1H6D0Z0_9HYPH|nr:MurR/RpiR family transcriptional regulator [Bosea lathyri]SEG78962.1 transcriptional regulator, RpiR family [Bosea lathyri]